MSQGSKKQIQGGGFKYYFCQTPAKTAKGSPIWLSMFVVDISVETTT